MKRYAIHTSFFIMAESDAKAIEISKFMAKMQHLELKNNCTVDAAFELAEGQLYPRRINQKISKII